MSMELSVLGPLAGRSFAITGKPKLMLLQPTNLPLLRLSTLSLLVLCNSKHSETLIVISEGIIINGEKQEREDKSPHSDATVCVSGLPYSITNAQLEEAFSDVGPVRRCFMVTNKGSNEHRGFGFVKFALPEDVNRAIKLKNGSIVGGRKIAVKQATHRPSLQDRRTKAAEGISLPDDSQPPSDKGSAIPETDKQGISLPRFGF